MRFPRLSPDEMSAAQREVAAQIAAGPRGEVRGPYLALIHNPALAGHLQALGEHLRWKSRLPAPLVELAVLVTARRWTCQYEWFAHEKLARKAGVRPEVIEAIAQERVPGDLSADERAVYEFSRQLHRSGGVDDAAFEAVRARFGREGALDLIALNGYYSMIAMVLNTAGIPLPDGAPPPLSPSRTFR